MNCPPNDVSSPLLGGTARENLSPFPAIYESPWVGSDFSTVPAASAFGVLARLVRLNVLTPRDLFATFGLRLHRADDLSEVMTFSNARQLAFAKALGFSDVPVEWTLSAWLPFRTKTALLRDPWCFRYCPVCLAMGYHTLLHQLPWFYRCPWHRCSLRTGCIRCNTPVATQANWTVDANLRCRNCAHELLVTDRAIESATQEPIGARIFVQEYLAWAVQQRTKTVLIVPDAPSRSHAALAELIRPEQVSGTSHQRIYLAERKLHSAPGARAPETSENFRRLDDLRRDRPGFLQVPDFMRRALASVASNLALKLPPHSLTDREMHMFLVGMGIRAPPAFQPAIREDSGSVSMLPPASVAGQQYLNLTCVHPSSYRAITHLIDAAMDSSLATGNQGQVSPAEASILMQVSRDILCRGYAEGIRSVLSRHVSELYGMSRDRPHLTEPWIMAVFDNSALCLARTIWRPIPRGMFGEADVLEQADAANRRRQKAQAGRRTRKRP